MIDSRMVGMEGRARSVYRPCRHNTTSKKVHLKKDMLRPVEVGGHGERIGGSILPAKKVVCFSLGTVSMAGVYPVAISTPIGQTGR